MIREGKSKEERFLVLKEIAEYQIRILNEAQNISNKIEAHKKSVTFFSFSKKRLQKGERVLCRSGLNFETKIRWVLR